ncbi:hypothetical protein [Spiroplasma cantharicola]|uniref:HTH rpiR-type domain-containing protein n=1 Tax=Spiroplasma cantharicola TaxID=362837 RepID=A0A0M3SJE6_9MOLU|nr:hypothetical protein [Spiroplasma cantharicola]ALD66618.1 hypothetical protein SCANT_v1c07120 [Spiroplasma cantharicola]
MNSIYTRIDNLGRENRNTIYRIISKKILEDFSNGIFRTQDDLAYICNCSKATITAFSKAALVSGYRELQIRLKIEYENNFDSNKSNINQIEKEFSTTIQHLEKWAIANFEKIESFFSGNTKNEFHIFSGYQTYYSTYFLEDILEKNNMNVRLIKLDKDIISIKSKNYNEINSIFILSGRDTDSLRGFFEYVYNKNSNIIVIASLNWEHYLNSKKVRSIYFDNEHFSKGYLDRNFQLIYLWKYLDFKLNL